MKVSICIPTWEQYGKGVEFLEKNFRSINSQTYKNFNVIISDHSKDESINTLCEIYSTNFEIKYIKNENFVGNSPANTNNAIKNADGDIVKILFQDDFFYKENSLELIVEKFKDKDCYWLVNGCNHTNDNGTTFVNFMVPRWNDQIPYGVNTISSPSVLSFKNNKVCFFDENLKMLMDCEMYYQLYKKYGLPEIIQDYLITNRLHEYQISRLYNESIESEINYVKKKYNVNI